MLCVSLFLATLITLANGKKRIMYKSYTYVNTGKIKGSPDYRWMCTYLQCRSHLIVSLDLDIRKVVEAHRHDPPKFTKTPKGTYI